MIQLLSACVMPASDRNAVAAAYERFGDSERARKINYEAKLTHMVTQAALEDAGVDLRQKDRTRIGLVFVTVYGGMESYESFRAGRLRSDVQPHAFANSIACTPASIIGMAYRLTGPAVTLSEGAHSATTALGVAGQLINSGMVDMLIVAGCRVTSLSSRAAGAPIGEDGAAAILIAADTLPYGRALACDLRDGALSVNQRSRETERIILPFGNEDRNCDSFFNLAMRLAQILPVDTGGEWPT